VIVFANFNWSWGWIFSLAGTVGLCSWAMSGFRKIEVGWRGQLLCLGERMSHTMQEGWHWVPFPFGVKVADCRHQSMQIDPLTVLTADNIEVEIRGTLVSYVENLDLYFNVDEATIKHGIDDTWDEIIRTQVVGMPFQEVKGLHVQVSEHAKAALESQATSLWGIRVVRIPVTIKASSKEVVADLELEARKKLQRAGQKVELQHFSERVQELMTPQPEGPGLSREQAIEQVQLSLNKASKKIDSKTIALDPATAAMVERILGGGK